METVGSWWQKTDPAEKQNIMSAVGVTSAGRGTGGHEQEPEAESDNKGPKERREEFARDLPAAG